MPTTGPAGTPRGRLQRRHVLMLVLAVEIIVAGAVHVRFGRPGIAVEETVTRGHVIT